MRTSLTIGAWIIGALLSIAAVVLIFAYLIIPVGDWVVDHTFGDDKEGTQVTTTSTPTPASGNGTDNGPTVLTEDRIRELVTEEIDKAAAADPSISASQVKEMIDKAVADAMATIAKTGGLTEEQVKEVVANAISGASASATASTAPVKAASKWPTSPAEAAATFAPETDPTRWEEAAEGGWHLKEEPFSVLLNPRGFLAEGYFDTKPGRNPQCFAFTVPMGVQGATVWPETGTLASATALQAKMAVPKWDDGSSNHPCEVMAQ